MESSMERALNLAALRMKICCCHSSGIVVRHSVAMDLLQQGVDRSVIALWLGHESIETTEVYLHASMAMKEKALARATPSKTRNGRYRPADRLLAFLKSL